MMPVYGKIQTYEAFTNIEASSGTVHLSRNKSYRTLGVLASYSIFGSSFCPPLRPLDCAKTALSLW